MYIEINPIWYDSAEEFNASILSGEEKTPSANFYKKASKTLLRIDTIRQIREQETYDKSLKYCRVVVSDDHTEDILLTMEEGTFIKEKLKELTKNGTDKLSQEIYALTTAIRNLHELLRARLHSYSFYKK